MTDTTAAPSVTLNPYLEGVALNKEELALAARKTAEAHAFLKEERARLVAAIRAIDEILPPVGKALPPRAPRVALGVKAPADVVTP